MRPVNLLPPEDRRGDHAPLRAGVASYAIVAVLAVALVGVVLMILEGNKITDAESQIASLEARKAQAQAHANDLAPYDEFASLEQARDATVTSLAQSRFDWERVLNELAIVIPHKIALENITASAAAGGAPTEGTAAVAPVDASVTGPSLEITGCARDQRGTARFLASLRDIDGVTRVGMQSSTLSEDSGAGADPATAPTPEAGGDAGITSCDLKPGVAKFTVTVAFDAVPTPALAAPESASPATLVPPVEPTTDGSEVETASAEHQESVDSANEQVSKANAGADAVGVGGE